MSVSPPRPLDVRVRCFAGAAEAVGGQTLTLTLPPGSTAGDAVDRLAGQHPALAPMRPHLATAVNETYVGPDHPLEPGDELALIPPVSGGS